jgi:beta-aspartyl-peptidase (threonine type)
MVGRDYFTTPARLEQLRRAQHEAAEDAESDSRGQPIPVGRQTPTADSNEPIDPDRKFGTVGAVALDANGNLAAATSTGGITNKQVGRVGDAPVIGAGTYANNATCAVSCTGTGEMYIRMVAAYDVAARMQYGGATLAEAADAVMFEALPSIGGKGGLIAVDQHGNIALPFNTDRMYRGYARVGEQPVTEIYPT